MTAWKHPRLGAIDLMPPGLRPKKVWQHFYDEAEYWDRLCDEDVAPFRGEAESIVGLRRQDRQALPRLDGARWHRARDLMVRHHDAFYALAYRAEMVAPETVWTPGMDAKHRHRALTPRSVFLVIQLDQPSWVVTAFRPHPDLRGVEWDEADLRRHAVWYFRKETGMNVEELTRTVAENLQRASSAPPGSVRDLWWLASAVGYGRLLGDHAAVRSHIDVAEGALAGAATGLAEQLKRSMDWGGCLERLAEALKETRPEDLEAALTSSEELLAVAGAVGAEERAKEFCEEVEHLVAWVPPEWHHLAGWARARSAAFAGSESLVVRLWESVEDAAVAALAREAEPVVRPAARLVDSLMPTQHRWARWMDRIAALPERAAAAVGDWVDASLDSVTVLQPAPAMGGAARDGEPWEVHGKPVSDAPTYRVFVVDDDHPDGNEVTEHFTPADGFLWQIDAADDRALVVVVAGEAPLKQLGLHALLDEAARRSDVVVRAREVQPTQTTKAKR